MFNSLELCTFTIVSVALDPIRKRVLLIQKICYTIVSVVLKDYNLFKNKSIVNTEDILHNCFSSPKKTTTSLKISPLLIQKISSTIVSVALDPA